MNLYPYLQTEESLKRLASGSEPLDISLTNDFAFKKTFRNRKALTGLLSSLLAVPATSITELEFPDTFLHGEYAESREGILDVKVLLNRTRYINIEIQMHSYPYWEERSLFYLSRMYAEDFCKGEDYSSLKECIHISILGFNQQSADYLYSIVKLVDIRGHKVYSSKMSLRVLYLNQIQNATKEERQSDVYKWARLISARDWEVLREMAGSDEYMNAAVEEMAKINTDKDLRYQYLMREKAASDETTIRNYYARKMEEERQAGLMEGQQEGQRRINRLIQLLLERSRGGDISRMIHDSDFQEALMKEFGL